MLDRVEKDLAAKGLRPVENQKLESRSPGALRSSSVLGGTKTPSPKFAPQGFCGGGEFFSGVILVACLVAEELRSEGRSRDFVSLALPAELTVRIRLRAWENRLLGL